MRLPKIQALKNIAEIAHEFNVKYSMNLTKKIVEIEKNSSS